MPCPYEIPWMDDPHRQTCRMSANLTAVFLHKPDAGKAHLANAERATCLPFQGGPAGPLVLQTGQAVGQGECILLGFPFRSP